MSQFARHTLSVDVPYWKGRMALGFEKKKQGLTMNPSSAREEHGAEESQPAWPREPSAPGSWSLCLESVFPEHQIRA